jgi:hypothetical protein
VALCTASRPLGVNRTRSPAAVSQKREFFKCPPETIGYFVLRMPRIGARRPVGSSQKPAIGGPFCEYQVHFLRAPDCLAGAGGFELRYGELESDALAYPRGAAEPRFVEIRKSFETLEFRKPYRICGVQSFGEKWAFRRIMSGLCRLGVRSSNEKSLRLLGLIANKFTRRIRGFDQGGGGRGTGIEPSPRSPE